MADEEELSMSEAIAAFTGTPEGAEPEADANSDDDASTELEDGAEGQPDPDEGDDSESADPDDEGEGEPDEDGQPDDEGDDEEAGEGRFAADDHRVRLSDGTFATVAELKAGNLRDRDYRQKTMSHSEAVKAFEQTRQTVEQRQTQLQEQFQYTEALLQSIIPKPPEAALLDTDPMGYFQQERQYKEFAQHLQYIQSQLTGSKQEQEAKRESERKGRMETSWEALLAEAPELKDGKKVEALVADLRDYGTQFGFSPQELAEVPLDHRQVLVMRKAIAWDKLQAKNKAAKPVATTNRPPVQKGGKRLNGGDIQARTRNDAMAKLNKTGSVKDGIAAYLASQG